MTTISAPGLERFGVTGFLAVAVTVVPRVDQHLQLKFLGNFKSFISAAVINQNGLVHIVFWDRAVGFSQRLGSVVSGYDNNDFGVIDPLRVANSSCHSKQ